MNSKDIRTKRGLHWKRECGPLSSSGFTPDHAKIATKSLKEAQDKDQYIFIGMREILEKNDSVCLNDETDRLTLCHNLSSWVKQNLRKIQSF